LELFDCQGTKKQISSGAKPCEKTTFSLLFPSFAPRTKLDFIGNKQVTVTLDDFQLDYLQEK
jgi:hypothetical protein